MGGVEHDRAGARVSHIPHVLAALAARRAAMGHGIEMQDLQRLASSGFRDTTRVAAGSPSMWAGILWENDVAVRECLHSCLADLQHLIKLLELQDRPATEQWLEEGKQARLTIKPF